MDGSLFVAHQYVVQCLLVEVEGVVGGHDGTAWIAEEYFYAFVLEAAHQCLGTRYSFIHLSYLITFALQRYENKLRMKNEA